MNLEEQQVPLEMYLEGVQRGLQAAIERAEMVVVTLDRDYGPGYKQGALVVVTELKKLREVLK